MWLFYWPKISKRDRFEYLLTCLCKHLINSRSKNKQNALLWNINRQLDFLPLGNSEKYYLVSLELLCTKPRWINKSSTYHQVCFFIHRFGWRKCRKFWLSRSDVLLNLCQGIYQTKLRNPAKILFDKLSETAISFFLIYFLNFWIVTDMSAVKQ